jgi:para-nitrobenzyl esterase
MQPTPITPTPVVDTAHGPVRGRVHAGIHRFLGIPYAAAPVGDHRFAAPQPPVAWTEPRDTDAYGPTAPKPPYPAPLDSILDEVDIPGDDWLNLNVWAPAEGDSHPVLVWIHGGAFVNGSGSVPVYDGSAFARDGVVAVTVNYRLGVDGFAYLPDASAPANRGLLDQIAALEWVRDNIAAFGGDPGNVTVAGESAGAMSVTSLLVAPRASGLFARAVTESGSIQAAATPADAALVTALLAASLGVEPTAAALATVDLRVLTDAQRAISGDLALAPDPARFGATVVSSAMAFIPVVDGDVIPAHPMAAIAGGAGHDVPLLTGTTREEHRLFLVPSGLAGSITDEALAGMGAAFGIPPAAIECYSANRPDATPGDVLCALLTDAFFRLPAFAVADTRLAAGADTWLYEFGWGTGTFDLGACHGLEIPFAFDTLRSPGVSALTGAGAPQSLADTMHAAWVSFATTGDPGWPRHDDTRPVMVFDVDACAVSPDPRADERASWTA